MNPTQDEIRKEIETLKKYRSLIPPRSFFGDDNLARIDAEIRVLEKNMSPDQIETRYDGTQAYDNAVYARDWLDGQALDGSMSDNWKPLTENRKR